MLKMSNTASKLKPMNLGLKDEFLIHLVFASLPKEYETFIVNYNMQPTNVTLRSSLQCVCKKRRGLKAHMVTLLTM